MKVKVRDNCAKLLPITLMWMVACVCIPGRIGSCQAATMQIRGQITDPEGASVSGAEVRLLSGRLKHEVAKTKTDLMGLFSFEILQLAAYTISAWAQGFRAEQEEISTTPVRSQQDVGVLKLALLSCESPDTNCDTFGSAPQPQPVYHKGYVTLERGCGFDLDKGKKICAALLQKSEEYSLP